MYKPLYDWLDEQEGVEPGTSYKAIQEQLKKRFHCLGKHKTIKELFECADCEIFFRPKECIHCDATSETEEILSNGMCHYHNLFFGKKS